MAQRATKEDIGPIEVQRKTLDRLASQADLQTRRKGNKEIQRGTRETNILESKSKKSGIARDDSHVIVTR